MVNKQLCLALRRYDFVEFCAPMGEKLSVRCVHQHSDPKRLAGEGGGNQQTIPKLLFIVERVGDLELHAGY